MEVFEVGGFRILERVGFEEEGLVWDETVRVVVEEEGVDHGGEGGGCRRRRSCREWREDSIRE